MCKSVYLARSAVSPTISGRISARAARALPNGAGFVRWSVPASEAIIAEVVRRGLSAVPWPPSPCSFSQAGRVYLERLMRPSHDRVSSVLPATLGVRRAGSDCAPAPLGTDTLGHL